MGSKAIAKLPVVKTQAKYQKPSEKPYERANLLTMSRAIAK